MVALGGVLGEFGGLVGWAEACGQIAEFVFAGAVRAGTIRKGSDIHGSIPRKCEVGTLRHKHTTAASWTVSEMCLKLLASFRSCGAGRFTVLLNLSIAQV
jgi:hypothetical protein